MQKEKKGILPQFFRKGRDWKKLSLFSAFILAIAVSGVFIYTTVFAVQGIVTASNGQNISLDTSSQSNNPVGGSFTTLGNIIITEAVQNEIKLGAHTFTLPADWEFDTNQTISVGSNAAQSGIRYFPENISPTSNAFSVYVEQESGYLGLSEPAVLSFGNIRVRPTGTTPSPDAYITHTAGVITGVENGVTNFGTLTSIPGTATKLAITGTGTQTAGTNNELIITAYDQFGNVATGYTGSKNLTFSGLSNSPDGDDVPQVEGVDLASATSVTFTNGVSGAGAATLVAYAAEAGFVDVTDGSIDSGVDVDDADDLDLTVTPATAGRLEITGDGVAVAGTSEELTITAKDDYGNVDINYDGDKTLVFSNLATSPNSSVPTVETIDLSSDTTINFSAGVAAAEDFDVTLVAKTAETADLHVVDNNAVIDSTGYDLSITVTAGTFSSYTVATQNSGTETAGVPFTLTITPVDDYENLQTTEATNGQINFTTNATTSPNATAASFSAGNEVLNLSTGAKTTTITATLTNAGETPTITATANVGGQNGVTDAITVNPASTAGISFNPAPSTTGTVDVIFTTQPIVEIVDTYGNVKTDETGTATINDYSDVGCTTPLAGVMTGNSIAASGGSATFDSFAYRTAGGTVYLQASLGAYNTACAGPFSLSPGAVTTVTAAGDATIISGIESNAYMATSTDQFSNIVTDTYTWSVTPGIGTATLATDKLTGVLVGGVTMTATSDLNNAISNNVAVDVVAGATTQTTVETQADGNGTAVGIQQLAPGDTLTVYAISRDVNNNFVGNPSAVWSLPGDAIGTLPTPGTSSLFTATTGGNSTIQAVAGGFTGVSGIITVAALTEIYVNGATGDDIQSGDAIDNAKKTIQAALDAIAGGADNKIYVATGNYTEDLVILKQVELIGEDKTTTTIKGVANVAVGDWPLAVPNIDIQVDGVIIHGFTIEGPDRVVATYSSGMVIDGQNIEIYDNRFTPTGAGAVDELGQAIITYSKAVAGHETVDMSGLNIHNNTFTGSGAFGAEMIYINPHTGVGTVTVNNNQFSGAINIGITAESGKATITNNTLSTTLNSETGPYGTYGIRFFDSALNETYDSITVSGNDVEGFKRGVRVGNGGAGTTSITATVSSNTLTSNVIGIWARANGAVVTANNNIFSSNTTAVQNDGGTQVTMDGNNFSDFASNANYPLTYLVAGTPTSLDSNPVGKLDAGLTLTDGSPASITVSNGGNTSTITITAKGNNSGNLLAGIATSTVIISSTNASSTISNVTDAGSGTYTATIYSPLAGVDTISATIDGVSITDTASVTYVPDAISYALFTAEPATGGTAGTDFTQQPVVTLYDQFNNILTNDSATTVTLSAVLSADNVTPGLGTLNATVNPLTVTGGVATFAGVDYTGVDSIKLKAVVAGAADILSNAIQNNPGTATRLEVVAASGTPTAGQNNELTITAKDDYGNVDTNYDGAKNLTFSGPAVIGINIPKVEGINIGTSQSVTFSNGVTDGVNTTLVAYKAETVSVDVTDGTISAGGTYDADLVVSAATIGTLDVSATPNPLTTAQTSTVTVNGNDAYGNLVDDDATTIDFLYSGDSITLDPTSGTLLDGVLTATLGKTTTGSVMVTAQATGLTQDSVTVVFTDGTAPQVSTSDPVLGSANRSINTIPTLTFSEDMATTTLTGANIKLMKVGAPDTEVPVVVTYSGLRQVIITPSSALAYSAEYYFTISSSVTDTNGVAFVTWDASNKDAHKFTTEAAETEAPYIANWTPADNSKDVPVDTNIILNFNEKLDQTGITTKFKLRPYTCTNDDCNVPITVTYNDTIKQITINPDASLSYGQQYYIYVVSTLKDLVGNEFGSSWQNTGDDESQHEFTTIQGMTVNVYAEKTTAVKDNTYVNGWIYRYEMTLNTAETKLQVQFPTGWTSATGGSIATDGNMRMLVNEGTGGQITGLWDEAFITNGDGSNIKSYALNTTYAGQLPLQATIGALDNNTGIAGRQIIFYVFTKIPVATANGIYTANYGIQTGN